MADSQRKSYNLFDTSKLSNNTNLNIDTGLPENFRERVATSTPIDVSDCTEVTLTFDCTIDDVYFMYSLFSNDTLITRITGKRSGDTISVLNGDELYICFYKTYIELSTNNFSNIMLNEGSTAKPYEPYGWVHSLRKLTTATEAVENPLYSDGTAITAYTIKGNTVQSGTPTPSAPISVNGVGDKTANLFDNNGTIDLPDSLGQRYGVYLPDGTYSIYNDTDNSIYRGTNNFRNRSVVCNPHSTATYTLDNSASPNTTAGFYIGTATSDHIGCTIVEGSTPPTEYIPYGYKIPISSGQTALNPMYLSGRLMKINDTVDSLVSAGTATYNTYKLVLTGDEAWDISLGVFYLGTLPVDYLRSSGNITYMSTHYVAYQQQSSAGSVPDGKFGFGVNGSVQRLYVHDSSYSTVQDFKAFLAAQYTNGTPVTIYYVRATPTTETVTAPSIPTTDGANSITVDTTVQPSEFSATWTGWHNAYVKEKSANLWNEDYTGISGTMKYNAIYVGEGEFTLSSNIVNNNYSYIFFLAGRVASGASTGTNDVYNGQSRTVTAVNGYVTIAFRSTASYSPESYNTMLNSGSTAQTYEPYWK